MRLDEMAKSAPIIRRYRDEVSKADPVALWQLGIDARKFSTHRVPGEVLQRAANVTYLYNPDDCREGTVRWLEENKINRIVLENATHWPSIDQPEMLAKKSLRRSKKPKVATNWSRLKAWLGISEF